MITLTSDFGSPYPAAMKGVILGITNARLVDIAHDLPRQDVRTAAFWLGEILPYFPPSVHLVVVDPGVGTDRAAIVVRAGDHALVGPDNGVLIPAARRLLDSTNVGSDSPATKTSFDVFEITIDDPESATFHGRDVFAPVAAAVHDTDISRLNTLEDLQPTTDFVDYRLPRADGTEDKISGTVLVVDDFGNVITNVPGSVLEPIDSIEVDGEVIPVVDTFAVVDPGDRLATVGSHGLVELDVNRGRGDDAFDLEPGDAVVLRSVD